MPVPGEASPLADVGVLVTRPVRQAQHLAEALERLGARVLRFPLIRIVPPSDPNSAQARLAELDATGMDADLVIAVSANAVHFATELLPELAGHLRTTAIACVGDATATAVRNLGLEPHLVPDGGASSEDLLAMNELQSAAVAGRRVAIIKGEGGRPLLARTLTERGADVVQIDTYRRQPPAGDLAQFLDAHRDALQVAIITSGEALEWFVKQARREQITDLALVLSSARVRARALELGLDGPFGVPERMGDVALAESAAKLVRTRGVDH